LAIYMDPVHFGTSRWLRCSKCLFHGDTIETYGRMRGITDAREAFQQVVRDGLFRASWSEVTPEIVESYISNYPNQRRRLNRIWNNLREVYGLDNPNLCARTQREHLWGGGSAYPKHRLKQFLGGGLRRDLIQIFGDRKVVPRRGYHTNLVLSYQDVPDRICAFQFLGDTEERFRYFPGLVRRMGADSEGGLAMLDALEPYEDTVFAVHDPRVALMIHFRHFTKFEWPLKLVAYNDNTRNAWNSVKARRVIFWGPEPDQRVFAQARQLGLDAGYVTTHPAPRNRSVKFHEYLYDTPTQSIPRLMERFALPWPDALAQAVMKRDMDDAILRDLNATLQFNHKERGAIVEAFPARYRDRVRYSLDDENASRSVTLGGSNILEADASWYIARSNRQRELISDAIVRVEREIIDDDSKDIFWEGFVRFAGEDIPFHENTKRLSPQSAMFDWLMNVTRSAGLGEPVIQPAWAKRLFGLTQRFSAPRKMHGTSRLGVRPDGEILFPKFVIREGKFKKQDTVVRFGELPANGVSAPVKRRPRDCDASCEERSLFTASAAAFISGLLAPLFGEKPVPVAVAGPLGSLARNMAQHLARVSGMHVAEIDTGKWSSLDAAQQRAGACGYPVLIDTRGSGLIKDWNYKTPGHLVLTCDMAEAAALATAGPWVIIASSNMKLGSCALPPMDDILWYLADLQDRGFSLPHGPTRVESVLKDLCDWYEGYLRTQDKTRYPNARKIMWCEPTPGAMAVELYCHMYRRQEIAREYAPVMGGLNAGRKRGILVDVESNCVFLPRKALQNAVRKAKLPKPDLVRISEDFSARDVLVAADASLDGWVIAREDWEILVTDWQKRNP